MAVFFDTVGAVLGGVVSFFVLYSLALLVAAACRRPRSTAAAPPGTRVLVLIPAHDEEAIIAATLDSLARQSCDPAFLQVVVVADNCTDRTAEIAADAGAGVWVRTDPERRGKGHALAWAIDRALALEPRPDVVAIVDADTWVAPDFVRVMAARIASSTEPVALQGRYGVLNPNDGWRAGLMAGAFELVNHIRPQGHDVLGLSVGLKGNGMAFSPATLAAVSWPGASITEDIDYGIALIRDARMRVQYVPEAKVLAQMPTTAAQGASQRRRWEMGRYRLLREKAFPLLLEGMRKRDRRMVDCAVDLIAPPLTEVAAGIVVWALVIACGALLGAVHAPERWFAWIGLALLGQFSYIVGGLVLAQAPAAAFRGLLFAPVYGVWKLVLYAATPRKPARTAQPDEWVRTAREPITTVAVDGSEARPK